MKQLRDYINKYRLFPFLVIYSYVSYAYLSSLVERRNVFFFQLASSLTLIIICFLFSKSKRKRLNYTVCIILSVIISGCNAYLSDSFSNVTNLWNEHTKIYKFVVVWICNILGVPLLFFQFLTLFSISIFIIFKLSNNSAETDVFSSLLIVSSISSMLVCGLMGGFYRTEQFIFACILSFADIRLYTKIKRGNSFFFNHILEVLLIFSVIHIFASKIFLETFIY